jgi:hypothetical protein
MPRCCDLVFVQAMQGSRRFTLGTPEQDDRSAQRNGRHELGHIGWFKCAKDCLERQRETNGPHATPDPTGKGSVFGPVGAVLRKFGWFLHSPKIAALLPLARRARNIILSIEGHSGSRKAAISTLHIENDGPFPVFFMPWSANSEGYLNEEAAD